MTTSRSPCTRRREWWTPGTAARSWSPPRRPRTLNDASRQTLATLGRYRVRDFDDPVELFQVAAPDLPAEFPPLRVLPADRHNLVGAPTTIVGRDDDLRALTDLVAASRLVSVVGPGGLGKTRLVTEYGIRCATDWDHGVWFVDLAPLSDPRSSPGPSPTRWPLRSMPSGTHWRRCWSISGIAAPW